MQKKSCFNCKLSMKHAEIYPSKYSPGEPAWAECKCKEVKEEVFNAAFSETPHSKMTYEEFCAEHCGHYDPEVYETCANCSKIINEPKITCIEVFDWQVDETVGVCSEECKNAIKEKGNKLMKQLEEESLNEQA